MPKPESMSVAVSSVFLASSLRRAARDFWLKVCTDFDVSISAVTDDAVVGVSG